MAETVSREVYVIGAGGHARVVIATLFDAGYEVKGVFDDDPEKRDRKILGVPVLGSLKDARTLRNVAGVIALGSNEMRRQVAQTFEGWDWVRVIHPSAYVHESVSIGPGSVVFAGGVIQPNTEIGAHVIVNTGATIDHDCHIGDFVHVAPGVHLAGNVTLGEGVFMGIGSVAIPGVRVGAWTTVGAGAAVVNDLPDHVVAVGVPARVIKEKVASL